MTFITLPREQTDKFKKNVASPHFTDQLNKTFHMCKTFRECPSKNIFTRVIQSATKLYNNEKGVKCEIKKKKMFRFSSQQFETDDVLLSELIRYQVWPLKKNFCSISILRGWSPKISEDFSIFLWSGVTKLWISRPRNLHHRFFL